MAYSEHSLVAILIKCLDIGYIYTISLFFGIIIAFIIIKIFGHNYEPSNNKSVIIVILELIGFFWLYGIVIYFSNKYVVRNIPFPLDGIFGHNHSEFSNDISFWLFDYLLLFSIWSMSIQSRLVFIYNKLMGTDLVLNSYIKRNRDISK